MADRLSNDQFQKLARLGALARLGELDAEIAEIRTAFPGLAGAVPEVAPRARTKRGRRPAAAGRRKPATKAKDVRAPSGKPARKKRRDFTPEERQAISDRMTRYWAGRRKEAGTEAEAAEAQVETEPGAEEPAGEEQRRSRRRRRKR